MYKHEKISTENNNSRDYYRKFQSKQLKRFAMKRLDEACISYPTRQCGLLVAHGLLWAILLHRHVAIFTREKHMNSPRKLGSNPPTSGQDTSTSADLEKKRNATISFVILEDNSCKHTGQSTQSSLRVR